MMKVNLTKNQVMISRCQHHDGVYLPWQTVCLGDIDHLDLVIAGLVGLAGLVLCDTHFSGH